MDSFPAYCGPNARSRPRPGWASSGREPPHRVIHTVCCIDLADGTEPAQLHWASRRTRRPRSCGDVAALRHRGDQALCTPVARGFGFQWHVGIAGPLSVQCCTEFPANGMPSLRIRARILHIVLTNSKENRKKNAFATGLALSVQALEGKKLSRWFPDRPHSRS